ncbi:hypothetical protein [Sigmofec virus UA08Rod_4967]|uniref:Uncharacterized protein n=1 Tax=Sigmofec virus UA08Rod_4967 TaxID=2929413 RepID=A0A976N0W4_9VIRU|nr:hypothetical protein [Sigmofec virus UA08Rod_4967]
MKKDKESLRTFLYWRERNNATDQDVMLTDAEWKEYCKYAQKYAFEIRMEHIKEACDQIKTYMTPKEEKLHSINLPKDVIAKIENLAIYLRESKRKTLQIIIIDILETYGML